MDSKCICDKCNKEFKLNPKEIQEEDKIVGYFICPHCKQKYVAYVKTEFINNQLKELERLYSMQNKTRDIKVAITINKQAKKLHAKIKAKMKTLKANYKKDNLNVI